MFHVIDDLNWLSVALAFVAAFVLAGVYFALVIAKPYLIALGREGQPAPEQNVVSAVGPIVCVLLTTVTSAVLVEALDVTTMGDAIIFGLLVGIGYLTAMTFQIAINPNFPRPLFYGLINAPYFIISSVVVSVIVTSMR